jgi:hypothetical protein
MAWIFGARMLVGDFGREALQFDCLKMGIREEYLGGLRSIVCRRIVRN